MAKAPAPAETAAAPFSKWERSIAVRYLRTKRKNGGVALISGIAFVGSRTWKVTLSVGTYKFRCDAHPTTMRGSFDVS